MNQKTPFGSLLFSGPLDKHGRVDPFKTTVTTKLSPQQQQLLNQQQQAQRLLGRRGIDLARSLNEQPTTFGGDFSAERSRVEQAQFDRAMSLLNPEFARQDESLRQRLANQGLPQSSAAFTSEMGRFEDTTNRAREQAALAAVLAGGQEQSRMFGQELAARQVPFNETLSLMGMQPRPSAGDFFAPGQTPLQSLATPSQGSFLQQLAPSLIGAAGTVGAGYMMSDRRLKTDIKRIGSTDDGVPISLFRYKGGNETHMGVMAQDVAKVKPEAVAVMPTGHLAVNYGKL